jgi:hypothetical protein
MRRSSTMAAAAAPSAPHTTQSQPPGYYSLHSTSASPHPDAQPPRAKKDKHAVFSSPPAHLLPQAATPLRGSPSPSPLAAGMSASVLNHGVTHHSLSGKADGNGRLGGGSPRRVDVNARVDVRI